MNLGLERVLPDSGTFLAVVAADREISQVMGVLGGWDILPDVHPRTRLPPCPRVGADAAWSVGLIVGGRIELGSDVGWLAGHWEGSGLLAAGAG